MQIYFLICCLLCVNGVLYWTEMFHFDYLKSIIFLFHSSAALYLNSFFLNTTVKILPPDFSGLRQSLRLCHSTARGTDSTLIRKQRFHMPSTIEILPLFFFSGFAFKFWSWIHLEFISGCTVCHALAFFPLYNDPSRSS